MVKESSFKLFCEGGSVEYNIQPFDSFSESSNLKNEIRNELNLVDTQINNLNKKIDEYNQNINRLTNFADGFDYIVSISSFFVKKNVEEHKQKSKRYNA